MKNLLVALALLFSPMWAIAGEPDRELHEKCIYPTVMIDGVGAGTGVIVKSEKQEDKYVNYVFTCAHILQKTPPKFVLTQEGTKVEPSKYDFTVSVGKYENWSTLVGTETFEVEVLYRDPRHSSDIAIVRFWSSEEMPIVEIEADPEIYIGNEVCRVGCGMGEPFRIDFGRLTSLPQSLDKKGMIEKTYRISAPTVPGDSGGPVFHENKCFGLTQLIRSLPDNGPIYHMSYAIPMKRFTESKEIQDYLNGKEPRKSLAELIKEVDDKKKSMTNKDR